MSRSLLVALTIVGLGAGSRASAARRRHFAEALGTSQGR